MSKKMIENNVDKRDSHEEELLNMPFEVSDIIGHGSLFPHWLPISNR